VFPSFEALLDHWFDAFVVLDGGLDMVDGGEVGGEEVAVVAEVEGFLFAVVVAVGEGCGFWGEQVACEDIVEPLDEFEE